MHMLNRKKSEDKIVFRVDANARIGLGHLTRCMAVAEMVMDAFDISIALQNPADNVLNKCRDLFENIIVLEETNDPKKDFFDFAQHLNGNEIVVLDGTIFDSDYQKSVKELGCRLVSIDDLHSGHFFADAIINRNPATRPEDYDVEGYTRFYFGFGYSMVPIKFQQKIRDVRELSKLGILFICFGGADPLNITLKVLKAAVSLNSIKHINVVTVSAYAHQAELGQYVTLQDISIDLYSNVSQDEMIRIMEKSQVAICPASSIVYEVFCIGLNLITGHFTNDQISFSEYINKEKLGKSVGDFSTAGIDKITERIREAIMNEDFKKQKKVMDVDQSKLIKAIFEEIKMGDNKHILN
jgi:UDP-2,4-diacetamido-2,4,6-trideoxy-beta-L-altropyranose hydrolase